MARKSSPARAHSASTPIRPTCCDASMKWPLEPEKSSRQPVRSSIDVMKSEVVRLFQTLPHACGYYTGRTAQNLVIDPASPHLAQIYEAALAKGYRRAGGHV